MLISVVIANNARRSTKVLDDSTTLRQALEEAQVDYSMSSPWLDGCALQPGDLDKSFADFGVTDHCQLTSIVKTTNAMTVKVVDNVCIFESGLTPDELRFLASQSPESLAQINHASDDVDVVEFIVGVSPSGEGSVSRFGVLYNELPGSNGKARVSVQVPSGLEDVKEYLLDTYGDQIRRLSAIEAGLPCALEQARSARAELAAKIQVIDV